MPAKKFDFAWWLIPITYLVVVCLVNIGFSLYNINFSMWQHLADFLIANALFNTISVFIAVSFFCLLIGVFLAWIVCKYDFFGRSFFVGGLVLPITIPPYMMSIVYIGVFDYSGILQTYLRELLPASNLSIEIRNWWGLVLVLTLSLYPYVYLLSKNAFLSQDKNILDAASILGASESRTFFKVALPMAYPWLTAGIYLVGMETLSDFGSFSFFGIESLTTLIYQAWFDFADYQLALQISVLLVIVALVFILLPTLYVKEYKRFITKDYTTNLVKISGKKSFLLYFIFSTVFFLGFMFPIAVLISWSWDFLSINFEGYLTLLGNSLKAGLLTATLVISLAFIMAITKRNKNNRLNRFFLHTINTSYALPSAVLAAGMFTAFVNIDFYVAEIFNLNSILTYSIWAMVLILSQRFLSPAFYNVDSALSRISVNQESAAATLGMNKIRIMFKLYLPLIKKSLLIGFLLVMVDTIKELPITLISRPLGFNTLAVEVFELTSAGMFKKAALPGLGIVLLGAITIFLIHWLAGSKHSK